MQLRPDAVTATAAATQMGSEQDPQFLTLRWVVPTDNRVTILAQGSHLLGRDASAATPIEAALVSRRHAEVTCDGAVHRLRDLDSKNGVFVNGERVKVAELQPGDVVRLGDAVCVVEAVSSAGLPGFGEPAPGIMLARFCLSKRATRC